MKLFSLWSFASLLMSIQIANGYGTQYTVKIAESSWRQAAKLHRQKIRQLLAPGLTAPAEQGTTRRQPLKLDDWTPLNAKHPIYNFLIEYYGLKGAKGPRRLSRWSPDPALLIANGDINCRHDARVLLEGATEEDFGTTLHLKGATLDNDGVRYSPGLFFGKGDESRYSEAAKAATPFIWYRSVMQQTLLADPVTHCHGLHEWAMMFHPQGAPAPPSGKYQSHLPLRVDRETINATVERKGISCTHVDALRFFAPAAGPLNRHGASLQRTDQLRLEQPACVHAHMDLLKIALRLQPFCRAELIQDVLKIALDARKLDVAASPYDVSSFGLDVIPIESKAGRAEYRKQQMALMEEAEPIRKELLAAYDVLLELGFEDSILQYATTRPDAERFAKAEPGGLPWRKNIIDAS